MHGNYRALSLDLWFTTLSFEPDTLQTWRSAREKVLRDVLVLPGPYPTASELSQAQARVRVGAEPEGVWRETLDPARYLELLARELGGSLAVSAEEAGARYSEAGLSEGPPVINPDAVALARAVSAQGIPVIAVTNTGRRGSSWARFFAERNGPSFQTIVTSCEVGKGKPSPEIFQEAARRIGLPLEAILHVGDRWDIDVMGARAAGVGRVLYRGLWDRYTDDEDPELNRRLDDGGEDVLRVARLDELLGLGLFEKGPAPRSGGGR